MIKINSIVNNILYLWILTKNFLLSDSKIHAQTYNLTSYENNTMLTVFINKVISFAIRKHSNIIIEYGSKDLVFNNKRPVESPKGIIRNQTIK